MSRPGPTGSSSRRGRGGLAFVALAGSLLASLALLECGTWAAVRSGWLLSPIPNRGETGFWWGAHPTLGVWRHPDTVGRLAGGCYDVEYRMNPVGARDQAWPERSIDPRVVVLGDSFLEGWGVEASDRMSERLELATGVPHLNFAMAHFSPYQQLLAYEEIASRFDHSAVLASVLPINDFADLDLELAEQVPGYEYRYRPYLVREGGSWRHLDHRESRLRRWLRHHSYAWNAVRSRIDGWSSTGSAPGFSWFYDFEDSQAELLEEVLRRLSRATGDRPLVVFLIPTRADLERHAADGPDPLSARLAAFGATHGFEVVNLLPAMADHVGDWSTYSLYCDYHWGRFGHRSAANLLLEELDDGFYPALPASAGSAEGGDER